MDVFHPFRIHRFANMTLSYSFFHNSNSIIKVVILKGPEATLDETSCEREGGEGWFHSSIDLTDLPIPHVAQYTFPIVYRPY